MTRPATVSIASLALTGLLLGAAAAACSSSPTQAAGGAPTSCQVAPACPDAGAPSYATEISPIIKQDCLPCHGPGGSAGFDESTYTDVYNQFGSMLSQVNGCLMPPANGPPMTDAQRVALTSWLRCGAPDN